jgi:hypothetical protein
MEPVINTKNKARPAARAIIACSSGAERGKDGGILVVRVAELVLIAVLYQNSLKRIDPYQRTGKDV